MKDYRRRDIALAASLSAIAGYVDAIGFLKLGGFFVSFMSGNSTRLGVGAATGHWETVGGALVKAGQRIAADRWRPLGLGTVRPTVDRPDLGRGPGRRDLSATGRLGPVGGRRRGRGPRGDPRVGRKSSGLGPPPVGASPRRRLGRLGRAQQAQDVAAPDLFQVGLGVALVQQGLGDLPVV